MCRKRLQKRQQSIGNGNGIAQREAVTDLAEKKEVTTQGQ